MCYLRNVALWVVALCVALTFGAGSARAGGVDVTDNSTFGTLVATQNHTLSLVGNASSLAALPEMAVASHNHFDLGMLSDSSGVGLTMGSVHSLKSDDDDRHDDDRDHHDDPPAVPEPATLAMLSSGLIVVGAVLRRRRLS
jgi:hypothetical protein